MNNYEKLFREKYLEEQEKLYFELFGSKDIKSLKFPKNYKEYLKVGIDRISLDIKYDDLKESTRDLRNIRVQGTFFNFFKTGKFKGNFYCKLDINLPKNLYGNNIKNVRDKKLIGASFSRALNELKEMGIIISVKSIVEYIEINKYIILDEPIFKLEQTFNIIKKYITKGHFTRKGSQFDESKNRTGVTFGTLNKSIIFYSKILEILKNENFEGINFTDLRKVVTEFKEFLRFEIKLKGKSLENTFTKKLTLEELLENPEDVIDKIFKKIIIESGLTESNLEINLNKSVKRLSRGLKRYKKIHDRLFIKNFVKDYSIEIWGNNQLEMIANESSEKKQEKYDRKNSLINNFKTVKTNRIDALEHIKKVVKDLDLF